MCDKFDEIMRESRELCAHTKKQTISSQEVETAVKIIFSGELGKHAVAQGKKALKNFSQAWTG